MWLHEFEERLLHEALLRDTYPAITPDPPSLKPGDCLLYRPSGLFGRIIRLKTWHRIAHVEIYLGDGLSSASRDGRGVDIYPLRLTELAYVLRPICPFNLEVAKGYTQRFKGTPYGWFDLLEFIGMNVNQEGIVCSPWATEVYRVSGVPVFADELAVRIAPFQFKTSELFTEVWSDGQSD